MRCPLTYSLFCLVALAVAAEAGAGKPSGPGLKRERVHDVIDPSLVDSVLKRWVIRGRLNTRVIGDSTFLYLLDTVGRSQLTGRDRLSQWAFWANVQILVAMDIAARKTGYRSTTSDSSLFRGDTFIVAGEAFTYDSLRRYCVYQASSVLSVLSAPVGSNHGVPWPSTAARADRVINWWRDNAKRVLRSPRFVLYDPASDVIQIAGVLTGFEDQIERYHGTIINFILPYLDDATAASVALQRSRVRVELVPVIERWNRQR